MIRYVQILLSFVSVAFMTTLAFADPTLVSGNVSGTWDLAGSPYYVIDNCTVPSGQLLTIGPGVSVIIGNNLSINVNGWMVAIGTSESHITIASPNDSIYWDKIQVNFSSSGTSEFHYCDFNNANTALFLSISSVNSIMSNKITNCSFRNIQNHGIYIKAQADAANTMSGMITYNPHNNPEILTCVFENSVNGVYAYNIGDRAYYGMGYDYAYANSSPIINNNVFINLTGSCFFVDSENYTNNNSFPVVKNNTFINNNSGLFLQNPYDATITNNLFYGNTTAIERTGDLSSSVSFNSFFNNTTDFVDSPSSYGQVVMTNTNGDPCDIGLNIFLDPKLIENDFHISENSPCIDAGTSDDAPDTDIDGDKRPEGEGIDIGADEFVEQESIIVLTDASPNATVEADSIAKIYGTNGVNNITVENGAKAELIYFPGNNEITIEADSKNFTVVRSGVALTLNGEDGTILKLPATTDTQVLIFNDTSLNCLIQDGRILLGNQVITTTPEPINDETGGDNEDDEIYKLSGINFGPFVEDGQNPDLGTIVSEAQIDELLGVVASYTESVRIFGIDGGLEHVIELAPEYDLDVYPGVWLGEDESANTVQMDELIALVETHDFSTVIIGSEVLYRGDLTSSQLLAHINNFKVLFPDVDVTYADTYGVLLDSSEIVEVCDIVYANFYPYWEGVGVEKAVVNVAYQYQLLEEAYPDKEIVISETGWPTDGAQIGEAVPSIENAIYYLTNLRAWADSAGVNLFFAFEAFDEPWKVANEGEVGANWGIWTSDLELKQGMQDIFDFDIISSFEDNWSDFGEIIEGDPTITITSTSDGYARGTVSGVAPLDYGVAGFIRVNGKWWTKPTYASKVTPISTSGTWSFDRITGGVDSSADMVAAFLIPDSFDPPTCSGSSSLPQSLYDNAVAYTIASM